MGNDYRYLHWHAWKNESMETLKRKARGFQNQEKASMESSWGVSTPCKDTQCVVEGKPLPDAMHYANMEADTLC